VGGRILSSEKKRKEKADPLCFDGDEDYLLSNQLVGKRDSPAKRRKRKSIWQEKGALRRLKARGTPGLLPIQEKGAATGSDSKKGGERHRFFLFA